MFKIFSVSELIHRKIMHIYPRSPSLRSLLAIHSQLYSFALRFLFLQTHATSTVKLQYTVKEKGRKPDRKPYPLPYGLRNPYRNLKSLNSEDYAQKPQRNCMFMNLASVQYTRGKSNWYGCTLTAKISGTAATWCTAN